MHTQGEDDRHSAGHPEFNERTVRSIVKAGQQRGTMGPPEAALAEGSYQKLDPQQWQRDYSLIQRICSRHLRK